MIPSDLTDARVLTVRPPWSHAIAWLGKHTENRTALWSYRGPLLIHAGAGWSDRGAHDPRLVAAYTLGALPGEQGVTWEQTLSGPRLVAPERTAGLLFHPSALAAGLPEPRRIAHSAVVAVVDLVDVHPDAECCRPWGESAYTEAGGHRRRDVTHLTLEDVTPLWQPIPYRAGGLGLRHAPPDLIAEVAESLAEEQTP